MIHRHTSEFRRPFPYHSITTQSRGRRVRCRACELILPTADRHDIKKATFSACIVNREGLLGQAMQNSLKRSLSPQAKLPPGGSVPSRHFKESEAPLPLTQLFVGR